MGCASSNTKDNYQGKQSFDIFQNQEEAIKTPRSIKAETINTKKEPPKNNIVKENKESQQSFLNNQEENKVPYHQKRLSEYEQLRATNSMTTTTDRTYKRSLSKRSRSDIRKSQCNGVVIVENLKDYLPENITKENIRQMVENALEGCIVEDESKVVRGKTVSMKQVDAIADVVYLRLQDGDDENEEKKKKKEEEKKDAQENNKQIDTAESCDRPLIKRKTKVRHSCINQLFVTVGLRDLTPELLKETCFKNKEVTQMQIDNAMKNLSQGIDNVKVLTIDLH